MDRITAEALKKTLRETFGLKRLRPGQREVIESVMNGEDVLAIMPTGAGKSLCYQLPALHVPGQTVVVSPLISLMRDQAEKLDEAGVEAAQLNSTLRAAEEEEALESIRNEESSVIFTTPERLTDAGFISTLKRGRIDLLVVDEAHCISEWGHDFRPAFLEIGRAAALLGNPPILALTATATREVIEDIRSRLARPAMKVFRSGLYRSNLDYGVVAVTNDEEKKAAILDATRRHDGSGIVYCATVKAAEEAHALLLAAGVDATLYHGRLAAGERHGSQDAFMENRARVMVATNAFGMGIDKPDIRWVAHYQLPSSLEAYYQESGRAGRDGERADCTLLYDSRDRRVQQFFAATRFPPRGQLIAVHEALQRMPAQQSLDLQALQGMLGSGRVRVSRGRLQSILSLLEDGGLVQRTHKGYRPLDGSDTDAAERLAQEYERRTAHEHDRLDRMVFYAQTALCRWKVLLSYFEEDTGWANCGHCDNCRHPKQVDPPPEEARPRRHAPPSGPEFAPGAKVKVAKYGQGRVTDAAAGQVTVEFPDGECRRFVESAVSRVSGG